ncbi:ABC transporter ATP-binding protein [Paludifilum halophilum]|uniref:Spermidine/putrescine ABC transporter ATP-binding protein n=1 Tax=Paludifilum halophilum TaxID=1642702 RepID=A0A235B9N5_9BACL|nr:ABC transporter ATP-binding protein [Paludifilum halophilum]OYD08305.1 spermidine/putrescine ABC transporter ATP-binding protein [Paludifilum halophilum]
MNDIIVRLEQVVKRFSGRTAPAEIGLELPRGEVIGVIGPNGAGKTTLLKLIAGLLYPDGGKVLVRGKPAARRRSSEVAYMPEKGGLYPFFTVTETVRYYRTVFADFDENKAREMLDYMQLDQQQTAGDLSRGERGRLKLVMALSRQVPLVLLDEPLAGLDPMIRKSILKGLITFIDLPRQTVLLSTHEVEEVEPVLDRVVALRGGKLVRADVLETIRCMHGENLVDWMEETFL